MSSFEPGRELQGCVRARHSPRDDRTRECGLFWDTGNYDSGFASISADGRWVAFVTNATNWTPLDTTSFADVFVRDRATGTTALITLNYNGTAATTGSSPSISDDGRFVAFDSNSPNHVPGDINVHWDVFLRDRDTDSDGTFDEPGFAITTLASVSTGGVQGDADVWAETSLSADGRYVAFTSWATNMVAGDTNSTGDVFIRDRVAATTTRVSVDSADNQGNGFSSYSQISADGTAVVFQSASTNLVGGDTNAYTDVFVHNILAETTVRVSLNDVDVEGNWGGYHPTMSADGQYVAFSSYSCNLVLGDTNGYIDIFVRDRGTTGSPSGADSDCDAVNDASDNCAYILNPTQTNADRNFFDNDPYPTDDKTHIQSDAAGDACDPDDDNDGLPDTTETAGPPCASASAPTDPLLRDTDGDRFLDGPECTLGTDPANAASKPLLASCGPAGDTDGDRITDRVEVCNYNSNPNSTDTDGDMVLDGAKDGCEVASLNADRVVNAGDQLLLAQEIVRVPPPAKLVNFDLNKDGGVNSGDQLLMSFFISPPGQCP
jgi:Tol biopolymer transport system component